MGIPPRLALVATLLACALPASASAALTKVADPIAVAPDAPSPLDQFYPDVAMAADGSFAVTYSEQDDAVGSAGERVRVQRFTSTLAKVGAPIAVGPDARGTFPSIAMAPDGRFVVAYLTDAAPNHHVEVQRFSAAGAPVGPAILPDGSDTDNFTSEPPAIAMADDGGFAVAWIGSGLEERAYNADGTPKTGVVALEATVQHSPSIGMAGDGRYIVTAVLPTAVNPDGITFANELVPGWRFRANGTQDGGRLALFTGAAGNNYTGTAIGMAASGASFLAFADRHGPAPGEYESDIWARRFDAAGAPLADRFIANDYTTYSQINPDVEPLGDGGTLVAYEGQVGTQEWAYVRQFGADDAPVGLGEHLSTTASGARQLPHVDSDGAGRMVYVWVAPGNGAPNTGSVYVGRWNYAAVTEPPTVDPGPGDPGPTDPGPTPVTPTPVTPTPAPTPVGGTGTAAPKPTTPATPAVTVGQSVTFPAATSCASRRKFGIRLRVPKGSDVTQATVKVNGRTVAVRKGTRLRSTVDLRNLPKGRFTVSITLKLKSGKTVKGERRYKTCVAKAKGGKPKV